MTVTDTEAISDSKTNPQTELDESCLDLAVEPTGWLDKNLSKCSEFVSPILVKEARQSLKSRQFFWTFFLLLFATAGWSLLGYALSVSNSNRAYASIRLLTGYWAILGVPLGIIIPFTVFRSLASEYENQTIQLLTITTMKPYQIVLGKLGGAVLQITIYFSILAPCICFTYLLRGVDLMQISFGLLVSFFGSLGLSAIGLFLAGSTWSHLMRIGLSVLFMLGLFFSYMGFVTLMGAIMEDNNLEADIMFSVLIGMSAAFFSVGFLAFSASSAQMTFAADNRSTLIRLALLIVHTVTISVFASISIFVINPSMILMCSLVSCIFWTIFGFAMIGEYPFMSPRVRRSLPESFIGKSFCSLLMPGPGRGYLFAVSNILGWTAVISWATLFSDSLFGSNPLQMNQMGNFNIRLQTIEGILANAVFAIFFLSSTFLFARFLRRGSLLVQPASAFALGVFLVVVTVVGSNILHFSMLNAQRAQVYSNWQILNWFWMPQVWVQRGLDGDQIVGSMLLVVITMVLMIICVSGASIELLRTKIAKPVRVAQEDATKRASYVPPSESIDSIFAAREAERSTEHADRQD